MLGSYQRGKDLGSTCDSTGVNRVIGLDFREHSLSPAVTKIHMTDFTRMKSPFKIIENT